MRYYQGKYGVEVLKKTPQGSLCRALTAFTMKRGGLEKKVEENEEFLVAESRFLWKKQRNGKEGRI